jgi:hypothetical protein
VDHTLSRFAAGTASATGALLLIVAVAAGTLNVYYRSTIESPAGLPPWLTANLITGIVATGLAATGMILLWLGTRYRRR